MKHRKRILLASSIGAFAIFLLVIVTTLDPVRSALQFVWDKAHGAYSVAERLEQFSFPVAARLQPTFASAGVTYPPSDLAFLAFKDSKILELYARGDNQPWHLIKRYPILAASGVSGPKLEEGDRQVPEGVYKLESLNPNSRFHLSMRLNYPNEFDRRMAQADNRARLGGDIMIHGNSMSVGCLAMGDAAAEELFVLSALVGRGHVKIIISPTDFRTGSTVSLASEPRWTHALYETLRNELRPF